MLIGKGNYPHSHCVALKTSFQELFFLQWFRLLYCWRQQGNQTVGTNIESPADLFAMNEEF